MDMDLGKESPHKTIINLSVIPGSSPAGVQSFPTTPNSERKQTLQIPTSTNVIGEKEDTIFDTFREIKIINEMFKKNNYANF